MTTNKSPIIPAFNPFSKESPYLDELTKWEKLGWIKQFSDLKVTCPS